MHDVTPSMELAETTEAAATDNTVNRQLEATHVSPDNTANRQLEATHVSPGPQIAGTFPVTRSGRTIL